MWLLLTTIDPLITIVWIVFNINSKTKIKKMACHYAATADAAAPVQVQYIKGPQMDWTINDGLYNQFKTWKIWCDFILRAKLETLSEAHKSKTLLHWSGNKGLELYQSWGIDNEDLTLQTIWDKFKEHCKPQANELCIWYDLLKQLKQGKKCYEYYALLQNQPALCQYPPETHNILERNAFLLGIMYQQFMSKYITEETNFTTADICQQVKKLEWPAEWAQNTSLVDPAKVLSTKCVASSHTEVRKAKMVAITMATTIVAKPPLSSRSSCSIQNRRVPRNPHWSVNTMTKHRKDSTRNQK